VEVVLISQISAIVAEESSFTFTTRVGLGSLSFSISKVSESLVWCVFDARG
jgi:hypothetical protein